MGNAAMSFAGVSVVGVGSPPQPHWATTAVTYSGYHLLVVVNGYSRIKNIPSGECIESHHFRVGGYRWIIQCYPNGYEADHDGNISFYLVLDQGNVVDPVTVRYGFSFVVDQARRSHSSSLLTRAKETHKFSSRDAYSFPCLIKRKIFEKSRHLKNDSFTIRCDIVITKDVTVTDANAAVQGNSMLQATDVIEQHLADLLLSGLGADVMFQVSGETFAAHRCVLAARSAVFKAQLFGTMKEGTTTSVIPVSDMEGQVFKLILDFVYSDERPELGVVTVEEGIMWQHLLVAADTYDLPKLKRICETMLCAYYINTSTVASILALADQHHCRVLKEKCLDFLNTPANLKEVMVVDGLDHVISSCPSVLKELIAKLASLEFDVNTEDNGAAAPAFLEVPESDMRQHFSSLLESQERTDVTFEVGGETFHAHRCVLAARSAVFRAELFGPTKDATTGVIRIDGMEAKVFKLLLTFIYDDSVPKLKEGEDNDAADADAVWQQLLVAADRYGLERLRLMCERALCRYINVTTVATILALAEEHHCRELKKECLDFFLDFPDNLQDVMATGGLEHLRSSCPSVLIDLIAKLASLKHDK